MGKVDNNFGVILEDIRDQNKAVLEAVGDMQAKIAELPQIATDVAELKQDIKIVKAAVTDVSSKLSDHERRLLQFESV